MDVGKPIAGNGAAMCDSAIAFVDVESVCRILRRNRYHVPVAYHLGRDGGHGYDWLGIVATDDGLL